MGSWAGDKDGGRRERDRRGAGPVQLAPPGWGVEVAFTDNCDLYAAVSEEGVDLVARHIVRQRPSLFNHATAYIAQRPKLACAPVDHTKDVETYGNPLFHVEAPLPLLGVDAPPVGLNFCVQLVQAELDFHPGNRIVLPAELAPPLQPQRLDMHLRVCGGLDCPLPDLIDGIQPWPAGQQPRQPGPRGDHQTAGDGRPPPPPMVPPSRRLVCVCLDVYAVGHLEVDQLLGELRLVGHVDAVDIVDIKPDGLEEAINCYLRTTGELLLREKLTFPVVKTFFFDFDFLKLPKVTVLLAPDPPVPHNPAVEDDQVKVFIDLQVGP